MIDTTRFLRLLVALAVLSCSEAAFGAVQLEGAWPEVDKLVTLDASGLPRSEAVRRIADAAGWNVVWASPSTESVDVHVKKQPATKILELVLSDGDYVARRQGDLIQIERARPVADAPLAVPAPSAAPAPSSSSRDAAAGESKDVDDDEEEPPPPSAPPSHGHGPHTHHRADRTVFAGNLRVDKDETVKDVTVLGGTADIYGTVSGDMSILGGTARIYQGAQVSGDVVMLGGTLKIDDGAVVGGDVQVVGGTLDRAPGAKIRGDVQATTPGEHESEHAEGISRLRRAARAFGGPMTRTAMLFVFGAVLLALVARPMSYLEVEATHRPMRSFALGVVGSIAIVVVAGILCVTLIGIPVAVVGILAAIFAAYAGVCAVLTAVGSALLCHVTANPYLHLAAGCALFLLLGFIPYLGAWITAAVVLTGIGTVVASRAAGYIRPRGGFSAPPPPTVAAT
jgi:hypothetical protein